MDIVQCGNRICFDERGIAAASGVMPAECLDHDGETVRIFDVPEGSWPTDGPRPLPLRQIAAECETWRYRLAARASQILHWRRSYRFCPACGGALKRKEGPERAMVCPGCRRDFFPRIDCAVIVAVEFGGKLLLAGRYASNRSRFMSILAGFVEPGENLEEAVRREVMEEVGLALGPVRYVASQPWPFPSQLMVGFHAMALSDRIRPDGVEIEDAGWFARDALPDNLPDGVSIARRLIDAWRDGTIGREGGLS